MFNAHTPAPPDDAGSVKVRILAAGRSEFARRGLAAGSVRVIAQQAGVTAAMINYYFGGKRGLYDAVVADAQERLRAHLAPALAPGRGGLAARLAGAYFDFLAEDRELQRLLMREVLDRGEGVSELAAAYVEPLRALFRKHFGADEESRHLAISVFGAVAGYFLYEPVLGAFLGSDPLSAATLARRRRHVVRLANLLEELPR